MSADDIIKAHVAALKSGERVFVSFYFSSLMKHREIPHLHLNTDAPQARALSTWSTSGTVYMRFGPIILNLEVCVCVCVFRHRESTSCHSDFDWRAIRWRRQRETGCLPSLQLQSRWDTVIISLELHKKCYFCFIHILNELIFILSCLFELKVPL